MILILFNFAIKILTEWAMANTKFEYVRTFEKDGCLLPNCWIVVRVDGNGFSEFVKNHKWIKPMDQRGVDLMVKCASRVCEKFRDIRMAFGQSDEFSFVLPKKCNLWKRREAKLVSSFCSYFASSFVFSWPEFFPDTPLQEPPAFDGRCILFPSDQNLRDYLSWRQADTHINHTLNCCFWVLVEKEGLSPADAQKKISGTNTGQKNEMMFQHGLNYNNEPEQYKKGTFIFWSKKPRNEGNSNNDNNSEPGKKSVLQTEFRDIIQDNFWKENEFLLL